VTQRFAPARSRLWATKKKPLMTMLMAMLLTKPPMTLRI
jgi:hypothetical protein